MSTNKRIRLMHYNLAEEYSAFTTVTTDDASYPLANLTDERYLPMKFEGNFTIDTTNNKLYGDDGASFTATITSGNYTAATLVTEIQTQLNSASSNWTVSYSTSTYLFTLANTGSVTITLSNSTNAIWDTIGFTTSTDLTGTSFSGDASRIHTSEIFDFDFRYTNQVDFIAILPAADEYLDFSDSVTITLKASNITGAWSSPAFNTTLTFNAKGIVKYLDTTATQNYRFWRLEIIDKQNANGPNLSMNYIYLGPYDTVETININRPYRINYSDPSTASTTISGAKYFFERNRLQNFSNITFPFLEGTDYDTIKAFTDKVGRTKRFLIAIDPLECVSDLIDLTALVRMDNEAEYTNNGAGRYQMTMNVGEVV